MARTKFSVLDVFANLLKPVTDAYRAETGRTITRPQFVTTARKMVANALRSLASVIEPKTATVNEKLTVAEPVADICTATAEPVAAPEVAPVQVDPLPFGMTDAEFTRLETWVPTEEVAPVQVVTVTVEPVTEEPAPVQPAPKTRKPRAPRTPKLAPVQVAEPAKTWTVATIATVHHIPAKTLRNHLANGKLRGTKSADGWTVTDADLAAYLATTKTARTK